MRSPKTTKPYKLNVKVVLRSGIVISLLNDDILFPLSLSGDQEVKAQHSFESEFMMKQILKRVVIDKYSDLNRITGKK